MVTLPLEVLSCFKFEGIVGATISLLLTELELLTAALEALLELDNALTELEADFMELEVALLELARGITTTAVLEEALLETEDALPGLTDELTDIERTLLELDEITATIELDDAAELDTDTNPEFSEELDPVELDKAGCSLLPSGPSVFISSWSAPHAVSNRILMSAIALPTREQS